MAAPTSAAPAPSTRSGPGCLFGLLLLPVVVVVGLVLGTLLNKEDDPVGARSVTLDEGDIDGTTWVVNAERDEEGDSCVFLYRDGDSIQNTGACTLSPQDDTMGDPAVAQTVLFGRAASDDRTVRVELSDGQVVEVDTVTAKGIEGRFYVKVVDGDVDAERLAS